MTLVIALVIGGLVAIGTFLLLRRDLISVVVGLVVLSQGANVYLISMGGITSGTGDTVPVLDGHGGPVPETADPLVQALVLTAIVISFGTTALALVLAYRAYEENETMDVQEWR